MTTKKTAASQRFVQKAKELGYDESETAFNAVLKKVAAVTPKKAAPKHKSRKKG